MKPAVEASPLEYEVRRMIDEMVFLDNFGILLLFNSPLQYGFVNPKSKEHNTTDDAGR